MSITCTIKHKSGTRWSYDRAKEVHLTREHYEQAWNGKEFSPAALTNVICLEGRNQGQDYYWSVNHPLWTFVVQSVAAQKGINAPCDPEAYTASHDYVRKVVESTDA